MIGGLIVGRTSVGALVRKRFGFESKHLSCGGFRGARAGLKTLQLKLGGLLRRSQADHVRCTSGNELMHIERRYTKNSQSPYALIAFETTKSEIRNPDGSVVFSLDGIEVPAGWSQVAADVLAQKYFRKAGVPARLKRVEENDVPSFLWRSVPDEAALEALPAAERYVSEISARQVFDRLAGAWAYWGWKGGYFD